MTIANWRLSKNSVASDRSRDALRYSEPLLVGSNYNGIPHWNSVDQASIIRIIEWGETAESGFQHGAITIGCIFDNWNNRYFTLDMRSGIQSLSQGGYYCGRVSTGNDSINGNFVIGSILASQPFVGGLDTIAAASNWINVLAEPVYMATGLDVWDTFYVKYEWQISPEPENSQSRPAVRLIVSYGTELGNLTPYVIACTDFDLMPLFVASRPPSGFGASIFQKWSIGVDGQYVLGPALREHTYIKSGQPNIFYYAHTATAIPTIPGEGSSEYNFITENYFKVW